MKGSDRRRTYLEVILNTQRDSESEQQNDVDMTGAGAGASGAAAAASGASAGTVTGEKKRAQEEAKRRMELWLSWALETNAGSTGQAQPKDVEGKESL